MFLLKGLLCLPLLHILFSKTIMAGKRQAPIENPQMFRGKVRDLITILDSDFTSWWKYKDLFPSAFYIGATPALTQKSFANVGVEARLKRLLVKALRGYKVRLSIIGGSISKGAPFSEQGLEERIHYYAIEDWWNRVFLPITGSKMAAKCACIGGTGTDYFSYCLDSHLENTVSPELVLWELAANDRGRFADKPYPAGQPLEEFTRNTLRRASKPPLLFLNFFRGHDYYGSGKCMNYEDEGGTLVAKYYGITSISWKNFVCDNIGRNIPLFTFGELFSADNFHPSILGHAQMGFLVINYIRNIFLRTLRGLGQYSDTIEEFATAVAALGDQMLPPPLYHDTSMGRPLCFTYLRYNEYEPNNTLAVHITRNEGFVFNIFKGFKIRTDKLGGMQTTNSEQFIQFQLLLPRPASRLAVTSHSQSGAGQLWVDNDAPVIIETDSYHMGTKVEIVGTNLRPGKHTLNVLSLAKGFVICAISVT